MGRDNCLYNEMYGWKEWQKENSDQRKEILKYRKFLEKFINEKFLSDHMLQEYQKEAINLLKKEIE